MEQYTFADAEYDHKAAWLAWLAWLAWRRFWRGWTRLHLQFGGWAFFFFLASCSAPSMGPVVYVEPDPISYDQTYRFDNSKDEVWDALIDYAAESFFAIGTYEKDSGLMTLSFSATPERYVDCGRWTENRQEHDYVQFMRLVRPGVAVDLRGNMNIRVVEREANRTTVSVNARYILTLSFRSFGSTTFDNTTWAFDSRSTNRQRISNPARGTPPYRTCGATGVAETAVLDGIRELLEMVR